MSLLAFASTTKCQADPLWFADPLFPLPVGGNEHEQHKQHEQHEQHSSTMLMPIELLNYLLYLEAFVNGTIPIRLCLG
jgi:hypothetical protein